MIPSEITTHVEDAFSRLLQQYKNSDNIKNIIQIYAQMVQELEPVSQDLLFKRMDINQAEGVNLDRLGAIVNESRNGKSDDDYRQAILVRVGINTSEGTSEDIISLFKFLTNSVHVHLINIGQAEMELEGTATYSTQTEINEIFNNINQVRSAATRINVIKCVHETSAFGFAGQSPNTGGFNEGEFGQTYRYALPFAFATAEGDEDDPSTAGFGAGHADPLIGGEFL